MAVESAPDLMVMLLENYIRSHSSPLEPVETEENPVLPVFRGIRAVIFDIYGTILISSAGDISLAGEESAPCDAMQAALNAVDLDADAPFALDRYRELIRQQQDALHESGAEFPEVEIRDVWNQLITELGGEAVTADRACVAYECAANPVWPMPGLENCFKDLRSRGLRLGIVSNAQFYTRLLFPALTGRSLENLGFTSEFMVFSYKVKEAKPSRHLYASLARNLSAHDIDPSQVLYVGNDRLKDIWPAQLEGFKTVLFAGDKRSFRRHSDDPRLDGIEADAMVTKLSQVSRLC